MLASAPAACQKAIDEEHRCRMRITGRPVVGTSSIDRFPMRSSVRRGLDANGGSCTRCDTECGRDGSGPDLGRGVATTGEKSCAATNAAAMASSSVPRAYQSSCHSGTVESYGRLSRPVQAANGPP
jgi:hypothetical protein